jgi:hypothetical protein
MSLKHIASIVALASAGFLAGCQDVPKDMSVVEYCANADNVNKDVCKLNVEIDGQKRALAQTNMTVQQARGVADEALRQAGAAQSTANQALTAANTAGERTINCETKTIARSKTGSCGADQKLVSCVQTHYTFKAGAPSIMRAIDDSECRFQDKVLEMQVRCCSVGAPMAPTPTSAVPTEPSKPQPSQNPAS